MEQKIQLNKEYIRTGSTTNEAFVPIDVKDNLVTFSNGAQCPTHVFNSNFTLMSNTSDVNVINESKLYDLDNTKDLLEIFKNDGKTVDQNLSNQFKNIMEGKTTGGPTRGDMPSSISISGPNNERVRQTTHTSQSKPRPANESENNLPEYRKEINNKLNGNTKPVSNDITTTSKTISEYEKVKLSKKVKLSLDIEIDLPTKQHIQVIREMFESNEIDYVEYMVDKFISDNVKTNTDMLKKLLLETVNKWVDGKVKSKTKTTKKKTISNSQSTKKKEKPVKNDSNKLNNNRTNTYTNINFEKIFNIESDEQLEIAKNKIEEIKEDKSKAELLEHIKNLVDLYEDR